VVERHSRAGHGREYLDSEIAPSSQFPSRTTTVYIFLDFVQSSNKPSVPKLGDVGEVSFLVKPPFPRC
jgi:hypothetical protein